LLPLELDAAKTMSAQQRFQQRPQMANVIGIVTDGANAQSVDGRLAAGAGGSARVSFASWRKWDMCAGHDGLSFLRGLSSPDGTGG
jgi:hypothetical protein